MLAVRALHQAEVAEKQPKALGARGGDDADPAHAVQPEMRQNKTIMAQSEKQESVMNHC